MTKAPTPSLRDRNRLLARDVVLDAAERLLCADPTASFSMRALAADAGVGFATPFNHFGSKNAIMQALSGRLIERMAAAFEAQAPAGDATDRVLAMGAIAVAHLLGQPDVHRAVVGSLGVASATPGAVMVQSRALWALALGDREGLSDDARAAETVLATNLAVAFRGCLSFWTAGEIDDRHLHGMVEANMLTTVLGFAAIDRRQAVLLRLEEQTTDQGPQGVRQSGWP
ncbi:TetR/AcrR family transcriptional regulator [Beijerinckia sp. L45]|uniref:TetR/AcrR family transcriptional regulator n=1 Tax=Beijerinckia sp. L45 TaxID=1641855 RepID=UPI00131D56A0|nr:TetR/AcrR family transcriptional regulator [Beijerinckia sp. L45]